MGQVVLPSLFVGSACLMPCCVSVVSLLKRQFPLSHACFILLSLSAMPLGSAVDVLATEDPNFNQEDQQDTQIYEKHDNLLHGPKKRK